MSTSSISLVRLAVWGLLLVVLLALVSCGPSRGRGGDDDDDDDDSSDDDDSADANSPEGDLEVPDGEHCAPVSDWDESWSELEERVLELTNEVRAQGANCGGQDYPPVPPLVMQEHLRCSSRLHSVDMVERGFFEHTNPDGDGPAERISAAGYTWMAFGENIGWGYPSADGMMDGWINSPEHCANLMSDWFTELGVGFFSGAGEFTWTQNFGDR